AADPAGHAVAVVHAVDVVPAWVATQRAGARDVSALALAFVAAPPGDTLAVWAGHDDALAWRGDSGRHVHLARCRLLPECITEVSGFSFSLGGPVQYCVGGTDWRLGRLDDGVAAAVRQHVPGFAEVHLVWFLGGDAHGVPLIDLGLALAVVLSDLT